MAISNGPMADAHRGHFWFAEAVGEGKADAWKGWDEMASCQAAFFIPSDVHQRTFIELYRMQVPTFMPDDVWLTKLPLIAPFGDVIIVIHFSKEIIKIPNNHLKQ